MVELGPLSRNSDQLVGVGRLGLAMACAIILNETYSIQAWFSGGLPFFLVKLATKRLSRTSRV